MKELKIEANANPNKNNELKESRSCEVLLNMPETVAEALTAYGEEVCFTKIRQAVVIDAQRAGRGKLEQGQTSDQIQAWFGNVNIANPEAEAKPWKPGVSALRVSKVDKLTKAVEDMSDEEYEVFMNNLKAKRRQRQGQSQTPKA